MEYRAVRLLAVCALLTCAVARHAHADDTDLYVGFGATGSPPHVLGGVELFTTSGVRLPDFVPDGSNGVSDPINMAFGPDGNLYIAAYNSSSIKEFNGTTGAFIGNVGTSLVHPDGIAFDPTGNIYVSDLTGGLVYKLSSNGTLLHSYSGFNNPVGLLYNNGSIYAADGQSVDTLNISSGIVSQFATSNTSMYDLALGPDGRIYASGDGIQVLPVGGGAVTQFATPETGGSFGIVYDNGNFYTHEYGGGGDYVDAYNGTTGAFVSSFLVDNTRNDNTGLATKFGGTQTGGSAGTPEPGPLALAASGALTSFGWLRRRRQG